MFLPLIYIAIMITLIILDFMILPLLFTSQLDFASSQRKGQNRGDLWTAREYHKVKENEGIITIALQSRAKTLISLLLLLLFRLNS